MKILLVIPKDSTERHRESAIPIGIAYINAVLRAMDVDVITCNMLYLNESPKEYFRRIILEEQVNVVCCGGTTFSYRSIKAVFSYAKMLNSSIITIGGGPGYTAQPELFSKMTNADYAVLGEGEDTIRELITSLKNGKDVSGVKGIIYKQDDRYVITPERPLIQNLDEIPFPNYEGMGVEEYFSALKEYEDSTHFDYGEVEAQRVLPILFGRSCPYQCKFCFHTIGNRYRRRSLDNFFQELDYLVEKYHITGIIIVDEFFGVQRKVIEEFCDRIKSYNLRWFAEVRVDVVSDDILKMLKEAGCINLLIGIESICETVLTDMQKHITPNQIESALQCIYQNAIRMAGNLIFITPEETQETFYRTFDWWNHHREYMIELLHLQLFPGTQYYKDAVKKGIIPDETLFIERGMPELNYSKLTSFEWDRARRMISFSRYDHVMNGRIRIKNGNSTHIECVCTCRHCDYTFERAIAKNGNYKMKKYYLKCPACEHYSIFQIKDYDDKKFENELYLQQSLNYANHVTMESWIQKKQYHNVILYGHGYNLSLMLGELERYHCKVAAISYIDLGELLIYGGTVYSSIIPVESIPTVEGIDAVIICQTIEYGDTCRLLRKIGYNGRIESMVNAIMQHDYFIEENVWKEQSHEHHTEIP